VLWLLLGNKIRTLINGFFKGEKSKKWTKYIALIGGVILFLLLFQWIYSIFVIIHKYQSADLSLIDNFLKIFLHGFFVFLLISGITLSIHQLYIASDLTLLISSPLSAATIFSYKIIETALANSTLFLFLGIPLFLSYGLVIHAPWLYYLVAVVVLFIFMIFVASLAFFISIGVTRLMPAARAKEMLVGLLGLVSVGIWTAFQIIRAHQFDPQSSEFNPQRITAIQQVMQHPISSWLPSTWAGGAIIAIAKFDVIHFSIQLVILLVTTVGIFLSSLFIAKRLFAEGIIGTPLEVSRKKKLPKQGTIAPSVSSPFFSTHIGTVFLRDIKLLSRDMRQLINLLLLVIMMIAFPIIRGKQIDNSTFSEYVPFIFIIMFSALLSSQLASRLIPMEARSFWIMMLVPTKNSQIWLGKFGVGFISSYIASCLAIIITGIYFHISLRIIILMLIFMALVNTAFTTLGLTLGSFMPKFDWEHPKRMLSTSGLLILTYGTIIIIGLWIGIIVLSYSIGLEFSVPLYILDGLSLIISVIIASLIFIFGLILSQRKLDRLEWNL
jgi:ABC-2 type transport system permease protein